MRNWGHTALGVPMVALAVIMSISPARAARVPISQRPAMGYNTWYQYRTNANQAAVLRQARLLISTGLAASGYDTVNLDDGWMARRRTAQGALTWNTAKFPHGIPWLATRLHSMHLKFGIYEAIGRQTCQHFPGSWGHYAQDAKSFARWGVNFVKIDECGGLPSRTTAGKLTKYFRSYGTDLHRDIHSVVYSEELPIYALGQPSFTSTVKSSASFANMWRMAPDEYPLNTVARMILGHLSADLRLYKFARPGHWNDLDMVAPDMPASGWTREDLRSQLSVWAEEASPLLISANLAKLTPAELAELKNPEMIAIDQSGSQAALAVMSGTMEAVLKKAAGGIAVLLVNLGHKAITRKFSLSRLRISTKTVKIHNVWVGNNYVANQLIYRLGAGGTALLLLNPVRVLDKAPAPRKRRKGSTH
jgi:alpha-galactosidase